MKYVEQYLQDVVKIKPLGKITTREDEPIKVELVIK